MYLRNYGPRKTCLDKSLKSTVFEDPLRSNMVNGITALKSERQYL